MISSRSTPKPSSAASDVYKRQVLTLVGTASSASAVTTVINGGIQFIDITNRGRNYTFAPRVAISSAPTGGVTGIATANLRGGIVVCTGAADPGNQVASVVQSINLVNPGSGYTTGPDIQIFGDGVGAAATAGMANGTIGIVTITGGGSGYTTTPTITFTGLSTVSAAATAIVSTAGTISAIHITNAGAGYTTVPTIAIASPAASDAVGNFQFNEVITGGTSGATARVRDWNSTTSELKISNVEGVFIQKETVTGGTSGAVHTIRLIDLTNFDDGFGDNDNFETEADSILDFSEGNPFGQP